MNKNNDFFEESEARNEAEDSEVPPLELGATEGSSDEQAIEAPKASGSSETVARENEAEVSQPSEAFQTPPQEERRIFPPANRKGNPPISGVNKWKDSRERIWLAMGELFHECKVEVKLPWSHITTLAELSGDTCSSMPLSTTSSDARLQLATYFKATGKCDAILADIFYLFVIAIEPSENFDAAIQLVKKRAEERKKR